MKRRALILPFLLFAALTAYYFAVEIPVENDARVAMHETLKLCDIGDEVAIVRMRIEHPDGSYVLHGSEGVWRITEPVMEMAESLVVGGMEKIFRLQKKSRILDNPVADLSEYGLQEPTLRVGIMLSHATAYRTLSFGVKSPIGDLYYARWEDVHEVFLVPSNIYNTLNKSLYAVRNKTLFPVSYEDSVSRVTWKLAPFSFAATYNPDIDQWRIEEPFPELAHNEKMDELIRAIKGISIAAFMDDSSLDDPQWGFGDDEGVITLETAKGHALKIAVGALDETENTYAVRVDERTFPVSVLSVKIDAIRRDPINLIEKRVLIFTPHRTESLSYMRGDTRRTYTRAGSAWFEGEAKIDDEKNFYIDNLLGHLSTIEYMLILNDTGIKRLKLTDDDVICSFDLSMEPSAVGDTDMHVSVLSKQDGFFIRSSVDNNLYEVSEEDYTTLSDIIGELYDR